MSAQPPAAGFGCLQARKDRRWRIWNSALQAHRVDATACSRLERGVYHLIFCVDVKFLDCIRYTLIIETYNMML